MSGKKYFIISVITNGLPYLLLLMSSVVGKYVSPSYPILDILGIPFLLIDILPIATIFGGVVYLFVAKEKKYILYGLLMHIFYIAFLTLIYFSIHSSRN